MFTFARQCAEPITQPWFLKVKVTIQGHMCKLYISCPLLISSTPKGFSLNFNLKKELIAKPCRTKVKVTCLSLAFLVRSLSPEPFERFSNFQILNFGKMFISVRQCAELITQLCQLKVKVAVKGHVMPPPPHPIPPPTPPKWSGSQLKVPS